MATIISAHTCDITTASSWRPTTGTMNSIQRDNFATDRWVINFTNTGTTTTNIWTDETFGENLIYATNNNCNVVIYGLSVESKQEQVRRKFREQMNPDLFKLFGHSPRALRTDFRDTKQNEILALQLLRTMVPHDVFKKYLKYGFVTVRGPSGLMYQIQRKSHIIKVWDQGELISRLCVYLKDHTIPPTDEVVAKMLICECDEPDIWVRANVTYLAGRKQQDVQLRLVA